MIRVVFECFILNLSFLRKKTGKIKSNYKREYLNTTCDVDMDPDGPVIHGSAVTE